MSLPGNALSSQPVVGDLLAPDDLGRTALIVDHERGGIALQDPSQGLNVRNWTARVVGDDVRVHPLEDEATYTTVITVAGITELSLSFDQNMNPTLAYVAGGQAFLYWYDTVPEEMVTTALAEGVRSPFLTLDDKRNGAVQAGTNDTLLFYIKEGGLYYRQQRDRYTIERLLAEGIDDAMSLAAVGMSNRLRVQLELRER